MSLKDRLKSTQAQIQKQKVKEAGNEVLEVNYYKSSEESIKVNSLGIVDTILADDEINSVFVNGAKNIYVEKKGKTTKINSTFRDDVQLENIVKRYIEFNGEDFEEKPCFNFNHNKGVNVLITIPPLSKKITLSLKCFNNKFSNLKTLEENLCISKEAALFLKTFCFLDINVLIIGEKKSLKTTILSALINNIKNNNSSIIIDYLNEIETQNDSFAYYDFSNLENYDEEKELLNSILYSNPDKLFINNPKNYILENIFKTASKNKGIITTFEASSIDEVKDKILNMEQPFDIIISTKKISGEIGKINSISQVKNGNIEEIFSLNEFNKLNSNGIVPEIYNEIKQDFLSLNQNIFDKEYKHTYYQNSNYTSEHLNKKNINQDILKKFKKDKIEDVQDKNIQNNEPSSENIESQDNNGSNENI